MRMIWHAYGLLGAVILSGSAAMAIETKPTITLPTRFIGELAFGANGKPGTAPGIAYVPGVISFAGGLPIITGSKAQIGAIGVSGGTSDQDEECAKAGLDAVSDDLK